MSDDPTVWETVVESVEYYLQHPIEFVADLVTAIGLFACLWVALLL